MHCSAYIGTFIDDFKKGFGETYMSRKIEKFERIKELRDYYGLKQEYVAKKLGYQLTTYARYEHGDVKLPAQEAKKIAKFFHVTTDYLLGMDKYKK